MSESILSTSTDFVNASPGSVCLIVDSNLNDRPVKRTYEITCKDPYYFTYYSYYKTNGESGALDAWVAPIRWEPSIQNKMVYKTPTDYSFSISTYLSYVSQNVAIIRFDAKDGDTSAITWCYIMFLSKDVCLSSVSEEVL